MPFTQFCRLGRDAEVRQAGQSEVANLALAYDYGQKDPQTGKRPTQWIDAALWGQRATALAPYLKKGTPIVVSLGDVHIRSFTRNTGEVSNVIAGRVLDLELAGRAPGTAPGAAPAAPRPAPRPAPPPSVEEFNDDDLPF